MLIYGHSEAPVRRLARADSTLCTTVSLSFGLFGRSWVLLWHFLYFFEAAGPRILNSDDALFVVVSAPFKLVRPSIQSQK
jgi:hypothetical protein